MRGSFFAGLWRNPKPFFLTITALALSQPVHINCSSLGNIEIGKLIFYGARISEDKSRMFEEET
jgi:hypothetical protein